MPLPEYIDQNWINDCIIVFDTSSICKMYDMTDTTKRTMASILEFLKQNIRIPHQVQSEYLRNREKVIRNPLRERYSMPACLDISALSTVGKTFIDSLGNEDFYHPYVSEKTFKDISNKYQAALQSIREVKEAIKKEFKLRTDEINSLLDNDIIKDAVLSLQTGTPYSYQQLSDICHEGEFRYRNEIPPGYKDEDDKDGFRKYGDLIVWKQTLDFARKEKKDLIFITDDEKEDWWRNFKDREFREELFIEFKAVSSKNLVPCNLEGFIDILDKAYKDDQAPFANGLEAVKEVLEYYSNTLPSSLLYDENYLYYKCDQCSTVNRVRLSDIYWDWDENGWSEREMGPETNFNSRDYFRCRECGSDIEIDFDLTEYPAGKLEDINIECDGGEICNHPDIMRVITLPFGPSSKVCGYCGRHVHELVHDMCDQCLDEFNYKVNKD